jgi:hypothetical protein
MNHLTDKHVIHMALGMWKNYIQTGDINLSTNDAKNVNKPFKKWSELSLEQQEFIKRLEALRDEVLRK